MGPQVRAATADDAEAIHLLHTRSVRALCVGPYAADQVERWIEGRTPEGYLPGIREGSMFVATDGSRVVGFGHAEAGWVRAVFVDPRDARRGVGSRLLHEALRRAGAGPVLLESTLNAVGFYSRRGFVEIERKAVGRVPIDVVVMRLAQDGRALRTPRLLLRPCVAADRDALHTLWTDPEVRHHLWDGQVISVERTATEIRSSAESFQSERFGYWVVCPAATSDLVGFAGLRRIEDGIEILFALLPRLWGAGLATEAARAVLAYARDPLELPRILGRADRPNLRSIRVLERLGMDFEEERLVQGRPTLHYVLDLRGP